MTFKDKRTPEDIGNETRTMSVVDFYYKWQGRGEFGDGCAAGSRSGVDMDAKSVSPAPAALKVGDWVRHIHNESGVRGEVRSLTTDGREVYVRWHLPRGERIERHPVEDVTRA